MAFNTWQVGKIVLRAIDQHQALIL